MVKRSFQGEADIPVGATSGDNPNEAGDSAIANQTEVVLASLFVTRYEQEHDGQILPENIIEEDDQTTVRQKDKRIGRNLAAVGDLIEREHGPTIQRMVDEFLKSGEGTFERFCQVANLILNAEYNWGRVMTLIFFGYRVAVNALTENTSEFMKKILKMLVKFFIKSRITNWIAQHGGWEQCVRVMSQSSYFTSFCTFCFVVAGAGLIVSFLYKRFA